MPNNQRSVILGALLLATGALSACNIADHITGTKAEAKPCPASFDTATTDWWVVTNDSGQVLALWGISVRYSSGWEQRCKAARR